MSALLALAASAAGVSLANGLHCAGMCGAFALTARGRPEWHAGRAVTYVVLGAGAGGLGALVDGAAHGAPSWSPALHIGAAVLASIILIGFSLRLAGLSGPAAPPGWLGAPGRALSELVRAVASPSEGARPPALARFALGAAGSLVPCGVVYAGLALAALAASPLGGAAVMAGFALGTVPALVLTVVGGSLLRRWGQRLALRRLGALAALVLGLTSIWWRAPMALHAGADGDPPSCHAD